MASPQCLDVRWILVESGALYSVTMMFLLGFSAMNTGAVFAVSLGQISVTVRCSVVPLGRAERLALVFDIHTCKGIHHRLGPTASRRLVW
jgi:hypothetical protein